MRFRNVPVRGPLIAIVVAVQVVLASGSADAQEIRWLTRMGINHVDPLSVAHDDTGAFIAGVTWNALPGEMEFGLSDAFVRKYSPSGDLLWNDQFGGSRHDIAYDVTTDGTAVYVVGASEQVSGPHIDDGFVRKYSSSGELEWTRSIGAARNNVSVRSLAVEGDSIYIVGATDGAFPGHTSAGETDAFVIKLRPDGTREWIRQFGTARADVSTGVAASPHAVLVAGTAGPDASIRKYADDGDLRWRRSLDRGDSETEVDLAGRGEAAYVVSQVTCRTVACRSAHPHSPKSSTYLRRFDLRGELQWKRLVRYGSFEHWLDATRGMVLVGGYALRAFTSQDGTNLWTFPSDEPIESVSAEGRSAYVAAAIGGPSYIARLRLP
ncbi:MAG: hypothetical protein ACJ76P_11150 [Actinomycetota bacterium]